MRFLVRSEGRITDVRGDPLPPEMLESILDAIMDSLTGLEALDPDLDATLSLGAVRIALLVEGENSADAMALAGGMIRTALHATGGHTPHWSLGNLEVAVEAEPEPVLQ